MFNMETDTFGVGSKYTAIDTRLIMT